MVHVQDAYKMAVKEANQKAPFNECGTPEFDAWLAAFDKAYARIILKGE